MRSIALLLFALALPLPAADDDVEELWLRRASVRAKGSVKIKARFPSEKVPMPFDAATERIALTVGDVTLLDLPPVDERSALRRKNTWRWTYRERRSKVREGVRRLKLDLGSGKLVFRARKVDLSALLAGDPGGVALELTLGETRFAGQFDFRERRWGLTFRDRTKKPGFQLDPGPGIDPLPDPDPRIPAAGFLELLVSNAPNHPSTANYLVKDQESLEELWNSAMTYQGTVLMAPIPEVDWEREMVIALFLGWREVTGYQIYAIGANYTTADAHVTYREVIPYSCPVLDAPSSPCYFAVIHRVKGTAYFKGEQVNDTRCPMKKK